MLFVAFIVVTLINLLFCFSRLIHASKESMEFYCILGWIKVNTYIGLFGFAGKAVLVYLAEQTGWQILNGLIATIFTALMLCVALFILIVEYDEVKWAS